MHFESMVEYFMDIIKLFIDFDYLGPFVEIFAKLIKM